MLYATRRSNELCKIKPLIMKARDFIKVTKYEGINRGVASHDYAGLAGMLVATVQWGAKSIKTDIPFALEILQEALKEKEKVDDVVKRYNRKFNH